MDLLYVIIGVIGGFYYMYWSRNKNINQGRAHAEKSRNDLAKKIAEEIKNNSK